MASNNRYIEGERNVIPMSVQGGVTVELGDLMFIENTTNLRNDGSSTATLYAFPFEYFRTSGASLTVNRQTIKSYFVGVAMDDKDGRSESSSVMITIGTMGKYKFPLKPARSVYPGDMFGASGSTSGSDLYNQKIRRVTDSDFSLGTFAERKIHAKEAEVFINTIFGNP